MKIFKYAFCLLFVNGYLQSADYSDIEKSNIERYTHNLTDDYEVTNPDELAPSYAANSEAFITDPTILHHYDDLDIAHQNSIPQARSATVLALTREFILQILRYKIEESNDIISLENMIHNTKVQKERHKNNPELFAKLSKLLKFAQKKLAQLYAQEKPLAHSPSWENEQ